MNKADKILEVWVTEGKICQLTTQSGDSKTSLNLLSFQYIHSSSFKKINLYKKFNF